MCVSHAEHVDVNLTPDKRQVMLYQEKALLLLVKVWPHLCGGLNCNNYFPFILTGVFNKDV